MRRRWLLLDALALTLVLGLLAARADDGPGPTWANFERVRVGMTAEEVGSILGPPCGLDGSFAHVSMSYEDEGTLITPGVRYWARYRYEAPDDLDSSPAGYRLTLVVEAKGANTIFSTFWERLRRRLPW